MSTVATLWWSLMAALLVLTALSLLLTGLLVAGLWLLERNEDDDPP